ncbi:MAG: hypothetical protein GWN01_05050 [Nitrosopumilaceae archaeon]|nr:hypothetical protein [Nitrosopumilaceae archaeon]NIU00311.1 hypothetical protein [Nitrosopumilaceae archaeon]NIU86713.1 hypothetical protein [Nitrosopumilaceae archaeon]NIV65414.1 hypothetical protein [Nitrosopumilaceae archaeon]NIX60913.1 hypothetical protein [Nitrosopumilaceae archaeon]
MSNESPDSKDNQNKGTDWSPEKIEVLLKNLIPLADRYLNFKDNEAKHEGKFIETTAKHDRKIIAVLLGFLGFVIGALIWLTWTGKIDGTSLLFVIGLVIGYVFAIIQRFIFGSQRSVTEQPEE